MTPETMKAGPHHEAGPRNTVLANSSENAIDALRAQYLSQIFALPPSTAVTIAELAFGEAPHA